MNIPMELARRIRIRSLKDAVAIGVSVVVYFLSIWIMHKLSVPEKAVRIISVIILAVVLLALLFALKA